MQENRNTILIVDDDARMRRLLERYMKSEGFAVMTASDGLRLSETLHGYPIKLLVLDLMLPGEDGLSICRRLRREGEDVPIIMLTAKGSEVDRIVGLEVGADDYLPKPFSPRELVARINAVLRRRRDVPVCGAPAKKDSVIRFGPWELNLGSRVLSRDGKSQVMTTGEFAVLEALVMHARHPLSRDKLMELARGKGHGVYDRTMDVQISRIRRMIEEEASRPRYIQTVWGFGYVFVPDGQNP